MANDELTYNGGDRDSLIAIASRAVAFLCDKDPADVQVDDDGDLTLAGDSSCIVISFETDPSAIVFRATLLEGIKESPALYALINEINVDIAIGQVYYYEESERIKYYYRYPAEQPSPELVATIISDMLSEADLYDDRLKVRLGGKRCIEQAEDEIEI
jgi:hypothetical protein